MSLGDNEKFRCCLRKSKHESSACVALTAFSPEEAEHLVEPATTEGIDELCQITLRRNEAGLLLARQSGSLKRIFNACENHAGSIIGHSAAS